MEGLAGRLKDFYRGKKVFITGHTGFKGRWLAKILLLLGAKVKGYALQPSTKEEEKVFNFLGLSEELESTFADIRDFKKLQSSFATFQPEIVFHLAAQPLVLHSYERPLYTYEVNVLGTANLLECVRLSSSVRSVLNITTDKVYENKEWFWPYRECDKLGGFDPYASSKACSEILTKSYRQSFCKKKNIALSTVRAGNVIGGGDFALNRIIPDCIRATILGEKIKVRNPSSTRPYQHVLEPLFAYIVMAMRQFSDLSLAGAYNVGPRATDIVTTSKLVDLFCACWGKGACWETVKVDAGHEANILKLDTSKLEDVFGITPSWNIQKAVAKTIEWAKIWHKHGDIRAITEMQIEEFAREIHI